jgi:CPA2 family monovalent cation:H+ antiporter-2
MLERSAAFVLLFSELAATRLALSVARAFSATLPVVVRAHRFGDIEGLKALGASDVISDELEGGVEVLARVLRLKGAPINVIGPQVRRARDDRGVADPARRFVIPRPRLGSISDLAELKVEPVVIDTATTAVGRTLADLALRSNSGAQVLALRRGEALVGDIDPTQPLQCGDVLYRALAVLGAGGAMPAPSDG